VARFLICTKPAPGHVNPALPVARELVGRGHEVRWYTGTAFRKRVEETGARWIPVRAAPDFFGRDSAAEFKRRVDPAADRLRGLAALRFDLKHLCHDVAACEFEDVSAELRDAPADVVITDPTVIGAIYACEREGLPRAVLGISILACRSLDTGPTLGLKPRRGPVGRLRNRLLYALVDLALMRDVTRYGDRIRGQLGLPPTGLSFFDIALAGCDLWLQPTTPDFEYPRSDLPGAVRFIGPLLPALPERFDPPAWWGDLEAGRPVVLVTQGTARGDPAELILPTLRALAGEDLLVVATTAGSLLPSDLPANARVEDFLSYHHLLPHVDVLVTNAGYGGVHFALAYGVPIVCAGRTEEKPEICARIAWAGVGIDLRRHTPKPARIRRAVRRVLGDPRYRRRAREIGEGFARFDAAPTAADLLEHLARSARPARADSRATPGA
jgi:UDP:flavonoid glycosyltransferase YjiC (YdhE family)